MVKWRYDTGYNRDSRSGNLHGPTGLVHTAGSIDILRRDPSDNIVLETAVRGAARYVVTGNTADFAELNEPTGALVFRGIRILTPREFVDELG